MLVLMVVLAVVLLVVVTLGRKSRSISPDQRILPAFRALVDVDWLRRAYGVDVCVGFGACGVSGIVFGAGVVGVVRVITT